MVDSDKESKVSSVAEIRRMVGEARYEIDFKLSLELFTYGNQSSNLSIISNILYWFISL